MPSNLLIIMRFTSSDAPRMAAMPVLPYGKLAHRARIGFDHILKVESSAIEDGIYERDVIICKDGYLGSAGRAVPEARVGDECNLCLGSLRAGDLSADRCAKTGSISPKPIKQFERDCSRVRYDRRWVRR